MAFVTPAFRSATWLPAFLLPVIFILVPFCIYWGYFAFFEIIWNGQTPGKRHAGIRVIKESGRPLTPVEAVGRNLMRAIDFLPFFYGAGILCMMLNTHNKRLGDYVAGTVVIHDHALKSAAFTWDFAGAARTTSPQARKIAAEELVLIETYLDRRYELDPVIRFNSARQIVAMIEQKLGMKKEKGQSDDDFLESVARDVRDTARFR
jgi:uncharacterized RDD family membrane protein YckC